VELAYPLRPLSRQVEKPGCSRARVIIPEPSLWDPESPFLYEGSAEIWEDGCRRYETRISHGLRGIQPGANVLRCNGRPFSVRGVSRQQLSPGEALRLRQQGYNTLLAPVSPEAASLWDAADRFGFLVLGRLPDMQAALGQAESLKFHASCLGWLLPEEALETGLWASREVARLQSGNRPLLGVELERRVPESFRPEIQFVFAKEDLLSTAREVQRPILLKSPPASGAERAREETLPSAGTWGRIAE
jgi:hypothetical protein